MRQLEAGMDLEKEIRDNKVFIIQYGRNSCSPCTSIKYRIDDFTAGSEVINSVYIDLDRYPLVAGQKGIFSVPTIEVYFEGNLAIKKGGYFSLNEILKQIEELLLDK